MCDVENPLLGNNGAAHVFGPQKGADPEGVELLEKSMMKFNDIVKRKSGKDYSSMEGAGAAGEHSTDLHRGLRVFPREPRSHARTGSGARVAPP